MSKLLPLDYSGEKDDGVGNFPFKYEFMRKFKFATEFLDLNDCLMGVRSKERPTEDHDFLIMDCFDVKDD